MTKVGVLRRGPFFYNQRFGILLGHKSNLFLVKVINSKIDNLIEGGLVEQIKKEFTFSNLGFNPTRDRRYFMCLDNNDISNLNDAYSSIKFENILLSLSLISGFYLILILLFITYHMYDWILKR